MDISLSRGALVHGGRSNLSPFTLPHSTLTFQQWPPNVRFFTLKHSSSRIRGRVSATRASLSEGEKNPVIRGIKNAANTLILTTTVAAFTLGRFSGLHARAEAPATLMEEKQVLEEGETKESPLSEFLESHSDAVDALKSLLQRKLEDGEDEEALKILRRLVEVQPLEVEWKFLMARLLNEIGDKGEARKVYEEILAINPLSFEALFDNALLMDRCGEGESVLKRLEEALTLAEEEQKSKEARDVRLIMAQIQFLQKNIDEALTSYQVLAKEDPKDFRPYFCQGVIYSLLDRNKEAREQFAKYHELSPKKFEVEGFLQTPLTRMKLFGNESED